GRRGKAVTLLRASRDSQARLRGHHGEPGGRPGRLSVPGLGFAVLLGLAALVAAVAVAQQPHQPRPSEQDLRSTIASILSRREYRPPGETLRESFRRALGELFDRILRWVFKPIKWIIDKLSQLGGKGNPTSRWLVTALLIVAAILILLHVYYTAAGAFGRRGRRRARAVSGGTAADPAVLLRQAQAAASEGDYRQALSLLYASVLLRLDRVGLLDYHPAITNWSYVESLSAPQEIRGRFRELTALADRALYAEVPVTAEHFARSLQLAEGLEVEGP
ncbi:MAG: DUF4129 domain-containing protein, partial [Armatimonadetes bacterium]|nr:DUF4129 domain-containing protein [Armatimonadota bacterium]